MGSDVQQQFCLRWHNFQSSLLTTLPQLLDGDDLTDVTLCAGGRSIKAHKVVLSACSQYFKDIFRELQPMQHPVIVIPGTEFSDLCALVTFMYSGEVNIYQHQLPSILSIAVTLQIRGLSEFTTDGVVKKESGVIGGETTAKRARLADSVSCLEGSGLLTVRTGSKVFGSSRGGGGQSTPTTPPDIKQPPLLTTSDTKLQPLLADSKLQPLLAAGADSKQQQTCVEQAEDLSSRRQGTPTRTPPTPPTPPPHPTLLPDNNNTSSDGGGGRSKLCATCFICGKQLSNPYNLRVHLETHQNAHHACPVCSHVSRSRDALRKHVSYRHPHLHSPTSTLPQPPPSSDHGKKPPLAP